MAGYAPIFKDHDPSQEIIALMAINFDSSIIMKRTFNMLLKPFIIGGVALVIAGIAAYYVIFRLVKPLGAVSAQLKQITAGDLSLKPLSYKSKDEIGQLTTDVNLMVHNLRQLLMEVSETSVYVATSSEQLNASAEQTGKASESIAEVAQVLASGSADQLHSLQEGSEVIMTMSQSVREIASVLEVLRSSH